MRIGQVSCYTHHGAWWVYYREGNRPVRRRVGDTAEEAARHAVQVKSQLEAGAPAALSFQPLSVAVLRRRFLAHHENVLGSSIATVRRYDAASRYLERFTNGTDVRAHEVCVDDFIAYLRSVRIAPNGHQHTPRRALRDKGRRFILEVCRSLYGFAAKKRHLPPYAENPFLGLNQRRVRVQDAKPVFVFDARSELAFLQHADDWAFPINLTLAKTGMRPGELAHLLIEDVDLEQGWLHVRNKAELDWRIKTGSERKIPLVAEMVAVLRRVIADRLAGLVFVRKGRQCPRLVGMTRARLAKSLERQAAERERELGEPLSRRDFARVARRVWQDAGAIKADLIRNSFIRITKQIGLAEATCPKSWRHTFATLLQEANVDPLVRQITLGHSPGFGRQQVLGMTAVYTHTRPETQRAQIVGTLQLWPESLKLGDRWARVVEPKGELPINSPTFAAGEF